MNIPKELHFILDILKGETPESLQRNEPDYFSKIDWEEFIIQARHHRIYPLLYSKSKQLFKEQIPAYVFQTLQHEYKKNTFQMLLLSAEMEQVSKLFNGDKIRLLFLKGPIIAYDLYGDISMRTCSDLDILVPINQLETVELRLLSLGYKKDDYIESILSDWKWRHHHVTFIHPHKKIKIEIHWRLNPGPGKEPKFDELWERRRVSNLTSYPLYFLGKEDLFLFLVTHGARHGWSRLRWLLDIKLMVEKELNFRKVYQLLKKNDYVHIGGQALILVSKLIGVTLTREVLLLLKHKHHYKLAQEAIFYLERRVNLHQASIPEEISKYHSRHLFSLMSLTQKALYILSCVHPFSGDAKALPLPKSLHYLYFPLRPITWMMQKAKKQALP